MKIFGYEIVRDSDDETQLVTPVTPPADDGAITVQSPTLGMYLDMDATYRSELDLLHRYRQMAIQPEVENAINDIVDEAVVHDSDDGQIVKLNLDRLDTSDTVKEKMTECFNKVIGLLQFNKYGDDIFRKWYVDGRLYYQMLIDEKSPINGIQQLIYIDSRKIRKVREVTKARKDGIDVIVGQTEYYLYNDKLTMNNPNSGNPLVQSAITEGGVKLSRDSVAQATSGLYDPIKATVLSYLHKAIRPVNQLRFVEDATVIYRVTRAPERRVFYVDTSGLSKIKAEQYLKNIMTNFRNKLNYDPTTGEIKDDRRHIAMLEDFWMPRNGEGKGTEITTLPAGQNLGQMEDVLYFKKALYRALSIPESRIENPQGLFNMGQPGTVTRDEIKFSKFIHTLRAKFSTLFDELMERQLVLTQVCTYEEWQQFKQDVYYVFTEDNNFSELKDQEILGLRLNMLTTIQPFMGVFFSKKYVWKNILRFEDDEIKEINQQIDEEHLAAMQEGRPQLAGFTPPVPPGAPEPVDEGPLAPGNADTANSNPIGQKKVADNLDGPTKAFLDK